MLVHKFQSSSSRSTKKSHRTYQCSGFGGTQNKNVGNNDVCNRVIAIFTFIHLVTLKSDNNFRYNIFTKQIEFAIVNIKAYVLCTTQKINFVNMI